MNFDFGPQGYSPRRIAGMSTAMILHVGVVLFLVAPVRTADRERSEATTDVIWPEPPKVIPLVPLPPKPPEEIKPLKPVVKPTPRPQPIETPRQSIANTATTDAIVDHAPIEEYAELAPESSAPTFVGASVDAAYGTTPRVKYTSALIRKRLQGEVVLRVSLDADGLVQNITVERSSGHRELDRSAMDQVRGWKFRAAEENGAKVAASVLVPISFKLSGA